jgi:hypothetical protein
MKKRQRIRPIPALSAREKAGFRQALTPTEDGDELWAVGGDTWWARWRTDSFPGAEFKTEGGSWWRAARVARVLAGYPDDPNYLRPECGVERCVRADHQKIVPGGGPGRQP